MVGDDAPEPWLRIHSSASFPAWLAREGIGLAFTTYQTGKLFLVGRTPGDGLAVFERTFDKAMGLCASANSLWLATRFQIWRFDNILRPGESYLGGDRLYVPHVGYTVGEVDLHDLVIEESGRVVFVATRFNSVATLHERFHLQPLWRPPFVAQFVTVDHCHLNGIALEQGRVRYVSCVSSTDTPEGWRSQRRDGGRILDITTDKEICIGLSMPHSPRVYRDQLWVLNSGEGMFGRIDRETGRFEPITFCSGYLRGLTFAGDFAVVGLSRPRHDDNFGGLRLQERLYEEGEQTYCGLAVIDLRNGQISDWLSIEGMVSELYDVAVLPNTVRPLALGFQTDEIQHTIAVADPGGG